MTQNDPVKTAARTLDVFEVFAAAKVPLTLTELANRLGSPISSCHALVRTLQARGYVYILDDRKRVYPTKRLLATAQAVAQNDPILERVGPILAALQRETAETVILGKRQGSRVIYLDVLEGQHTIRYSAAPGDAKPLHSSAIGKAMLGALSASERARLLRTLRLEKITDRTLTEPAELARDLEASQACGTYVTRGENVSEVMGVAIARTLGDEPYGVAVAGPIHRLERHLDKMVAALGKTGQALDRLDAELTGTALLV